jgi:hypothetical protein
LSIIVYVVRFFWLRWRKARRQTRPVASGPAAEFDQACLLGVQFQGEFRHTDA